MTDLPRPDDAMRGTPGATLAAAREAAGLAPADVAAQMRISLRQLEAIESDRYSELPGSVFVRGFIRNYARLLNLDPLPLLHALEPALDSDAPLRAHEFAGAIPVHSRRGHMRLWLALFVVLLLAVLAAAAYEYWRSRASSPSPAPSGEVSVKPDVSSAVAPSGSTTPGTASEPVPLAPERVSQSAVDAPMPSVAPDAGPVRATPPVDAATRGGRVELSFVAESWVEVRDRDGNVLLSATGAANTSRTVEGVPPLVVTVGNASGVRITYNQKPIDVAANASRNIARLTLE